MASCHAVALLALAGCSLSDETLVSADLRSGSETLLVVGQRDWEISRPILCGVKRDGTFVVSQRVCDYDEGHSDKSKYRVVNPTGRVVGLVTQHDPNVVFFAVDLQTRKAWPDGSAQVTSDAETMLKLLRTDTKNDAFVLHSRL